ncbi:PIN domain-like protein [Aaosphaeria arxii CBS 175.79]|uniref:PIN domain-like protein n=1 Tax=Aaosphaeria arxii CBS 175.79 TaxID=1450172 RepID=A0A6A5Y9T7_9PLEO|nr:PIN domain-like protein [Aaosphaeria arxii CBS 175.79]KAF2022016.1 PIN domain-like protein [Aaosphaeria arxii CBS 175.79]
MGVTGLWTVLQPCARPIRIETLNKKRLAVDASIWIYQFLKAVRDKEGNALRNSHIVGFFRRICKLLFFGIKPVFVFDGGAPVLKRQTISNRKSRREGRREDAVRTAGKLLAIQMQRAAEEEEKRRKETARERRNEPEEEIPENLVYAEEVAQTEQERLANRTFKRKDQYHLPDLGTSIAEMGGQNDPRIMSLEELEEYARQFDRGEDINVYDFSKIDFDSPFFVSLPASDRYNILNAARLRSRLRMGYSKEQLDIMFPDRMAFSKFQIERVRERNELTQRLMNLNGMSDDAMFGNNAVNRVAGEKGREYVLVKNDGVEGGWALGVVTNKDEGKADKPIDVDRSSPPEFKEEDWEDEDDFEDVPIEGLNRLPKPKAGASEKDKEGREFISRELAKRRQRFYQSRKRGSTKPKPRRVEQPEQDPDSLFLADETQAAEWEHVPDDNEDDLFEEAGDSEEDEQLKKAIALSLGQQDGEPADQSNDSEEDIYGEVFQQERVEEPAPFSGKGSGLAIARMANQRSSKLAPTGPFNGSDSEDDDMDLQAALAESRRSKRTTSAKRRSSRSPVAVHSPTPKPAHKPTNAPGFDGPLPFERLNLGNSILGKKKMEKIEQETAGGFEKKQEQGKKEKAEPLPPWFQGERDMRDDLTAQREEERQSWEQARKEEETHFQFQEVPRLRKQDTREVIDLDGPSSHETQREPITIQSDGEEDIEAVITVDPNVRMGDLAEKVRAEPPKPSPEAPKIQPTQPFEQESDDEPIDWSESEPDLDRSLRQQSKSTGNVTELEAAGAKSPSPVFEDVPIGEGRNDVELPKSPSPEFEDVPLQANLTQLPRREPSPIELQGAVDLEVAVVPPRDGLADDNAPLELPDDESDQYSDPEDAELFASLAAEAEEHARFAQELNNAQTTRIDFNEELKQLRAQQKKDRRDADEVTQTMIAECQHLLTLFGLPYITAPMEAEAQCAELVHLGLVDGIVTDDSDTFLFGGTRVYKNMFNAAKFVECYLANDLASEFSLTRDKLIAIAQLLGSDYTTGISGIGPVTALEILSEFGTLQAFKDWWTGVQDGSISKEADKGSQFRRRFRRSQGTKLFLPPTFPDFNVTEAYLKPDVDSDPQPFQWGVPDLAALRTFLSSQIGWSWERTDEVLVPVIKDMNKREKEGTQSNITRFFEGSVGAGAFAPRARAGGEGGPTGKKKGKSAAGKRLGAALTRLAERERQAPDESQPDDQDGAVETVSAVSEGITSNTRTKKRKQGKDAASDDTADEYVGSDIDEGVGSNSSQQRRTRKSRKVK